MKRLSRRRLARYAAMAAALVLGAALAAPALAAESPPATIEHPPRDPWVPPQLRHPASTPPTEGAALRAQVERKLAAGFERADVGGNGTLTREQARAGGLGLIVRHFDQIDRRRAGAVSFDDVKRYLREQGAKLD